MVASSTGAKVAWNYQLFIQQTVYEFLWSQTLILTNVKPTKQASFVFFIRRNVLTKQMVASRTSAKVSGNRATHYDATNCLRIFEKGSTATLVLTNFPLMYLLATKGSVLACTLFANPTRLAADRLRPSLQRRQQPCVQDHSIGVFSPLRGQTSVRPGDCGLHETWKNVIAGQLDKSPWSGRAGSHEERTSSGKKKKKV
jgi:hypothetical protein